MLKSIASKATDPEDLLTMTDIQLAILTASGISDKALGYFKQIDKENAIQNLISEFLKPAGG